MKKLVYLAIVAFATSMVACGGSEKAADATEAADTVAAVVEEVAAEVTCGCDTCACDSANSCGCDTVTVAEQVAAVAE